MPLPPRLLPKHSKVHALLSTLCLRKLTQMKMWPLDHILTRDHFDGRVLGLLFFPDSRLRRKIVYFECTVP